MTIQFKTASTLTNPHGCFVALVGGTNSGKTYSALRLARGIAGPQGKIAVLDTEGGRTLHLKEHFEFDVALLEPPFSSEKFSQAAIDAEAAGYAVLVIDSFSMEWVGDGGVLDMQERELDRMAGDDWKKRERVYMASWVKPKRKHKKMVNSFLQRTMPVVFAIRGEESIKPAEEGGKPLKIFKMQMDHRFAFEVTVSFRLAQDNKGMIDLSDAKSWKMESAHEKIFHHGEQLSEDHGAKLAAWSRGERPQDEVPDEKTLEFARAASGGGSDVFSTWWKNATAKERRAAKSIADELKSLREIADVEQKERENSDATPET